MSSRSSEERPLGYCTICTRANQLARVTGVDRLNNPQGICSSCAEGEVQVVEITQAQIADCNHYIMDPRHYREDGTCYCDDPDNDDMPDWGYEWNDDTEVWE